VTPDLVLLDIRMPILDGFGVLTGLRQDDRFREIPIFALTAVAMQGDLERALAAGFDDYITKPIRISALRERINLALAPD
jgi:two-component system cell cycle response regulator DivK